MRTYTRSPLTQHVCLCVLVAGSLHPRLATAQSIASLSAEAVHAMPGHTAHISVRLSSGVNLAGIQWALSYPGDVFRSVTFVTGDQAQKAAKVKDCFERNGTVTCLLTGVNAATMTTGEVFIVQAAVAPSAPLGVARMRINGVLGTTLAAQPVSITGADLSVNISRQPMLESVACKDSVVVAGQTTTCSVTLSGPAGSAATVRLSSASPALGLPGSVTVPAGASKASFEVLALRASGDEAVTLTAAYLEVRQTAAIRVNGITLSSLACTTTPIERSSAGQCTVTLSGSAPQDFDVMLSSAGAAVVIPASVRVGKGKQSATFAVTAGTAATSGSGTITAALEGVSRTAPVTVRAAAAEPVALSSLTCSQSVITVSGTIPCSLRLSRQTPASVAVPLKISNPVLMGGASQVIMPTAVTVPAGSDSASFSVTIRYVPSDMSVAVSATLGVTRSVTWSLRRMTVTSLVCTPATIAFGFITCTITLNAATPFWYPSVSLASSSQFVTLPATAPVLGGNSATFRAYVVPSPKALTATVSATLGTTASTKVSIKP
jgi:hypothetical protein